MLKSMALFSLFLFVPATCYSTGLPPEGVPVASAERAWERYGIDPGTPLAERVGAAPPDQIGMLFTKAGMPVPSTHALTEVERRKVAAAFAALTPLHRRVLGDRLRSISFVDGMPNSALTTVVDAGDPYPMFDITVRSGVLGETTSQLLTAKEANLFSAAEDKGRVVVDGGDMDAIVYVLLHEATHVVDHALAITPRVGNAGSGAAFTQGVWEHRTAVATPYRGEFLARVGFRPGGEPIPLENAEALYEDLRATPFASIYGSSNWHDDLAELVAWHQLTTTLRQPYRIEVRRDGRTVLAYEPMASSLVQSRLPLLGMFHE